MLSVTSSMWTSDSSKTTLNDAYPVQNNTQTGLADITVSEILELYKHDTELLKHILVAKSEEDRRRTAEEIRKAEEARLQAKYLEMEMGSHRRTSDPPTTLDDLISKSFGLITGSLGVSNEVVPDWLSMPPAVSAFDPQLNTPPSPPSTLLQPSSPYTSFEVPFADLSISAASSPEPTEINQQKVQPPPSPPPAPIERACKRTLSRTRSQRRPGMNGKSSKKNRSLPSQAPPPQQIGNEPGTGDQPLDHHTVMEALRAKIRRSTPIQQEQQQQQTPQESEDNTEQDQAASMSPTGILLLDLKDPCKLFPTRRPPASARVAVTRRARPFTSAFSHVEKPKDSTSVKSTRQ
ncbi:hypothetical protein DFQ28_009393 [Apophysomyces sp. BC1034]|nr:hypothetical protein DFQ30_009098 [Apophysomyces sp. BC1015]KAG0173081.1 hypothetical protein DFQ29_008108 [Apophysomyces sp. BC1021]KAG0185409.1 hypothetical protein DFQ28_009393 [Apophysomyces sp. BC1034]